MAGKSKPLVWLQGSVKTPPFSKDACIGSRCHELRIQDADVTWRIVYRVDANAVVILKRLRDYDAATGREKKR